MSETLVNTLCELFREKGLLNTNGKLSCEATALVSGFLSDMSEEKKIIFRRCMEFQTNIHCIYPSKADEAIYEGLSIQNHQYGYSTLRSLLNECNYSNYIGLFQIISIGGSDTKRHCYYIDIRKNIMHFSSMPFHAKFGTKMNTNLGATELCAFLDMTIPTFLMASIGYGVSRIVRANIIQNSDFATNDDEATRNAVETIQRISKHAGNDTWIIPRRIYGSDLLPLNMLGGITSPIKIDAGSLTWKIEFPDHSVVKINVDTPKIVNDLNYEFV